MNFEPLKLPWLPASPEEFRLACRSLSAGDGPPGPAVQKLANHRLDSAEATALGRAIARLRADCADLSPLSTVKLGVLANTTYDFIVGALPAAAARHGVALEVHLAPMGQVEQEVLDPASGLYRGGPDAVLLAVDHRWLALDLPSLADDGKARVDQALGRLRKVIGAISETSRAVAIVQTIPVPPFPLFGSYERRVAGSVRAMIERFNTELPGVCDETNGLLFDVAATAEVVGTAKWFDAAYYHRYKLPFSPDAVPLYCDALGRLLAAMRGKARKCLVLDLDNTIWGGVVGDDGLEGIRIGAGTAEGESFLSIQRTALDLKARGVILAVCSKNNDETARSVFRDHPDMLLREADIAVFQANWEDKPSNLEAIAATLGIGLDALVILDDNGAERALVRATLPMVATPELPNDPALYPAVLMAAGYFEAVAFSEEDRLRSAGYAANAQRAEVLRCSRSVEDYLASLDMEIEFKPFDPLNRARIAQLINKTNQFNLTTKRYTEAEVAAMEQGGADFTVQVRLSDRYGDFGVIGVIIAYGENGGAAWDVDTWLMSCRVLGRQVELAMLVELISAARDARVVTLQASYVPTAKNGIVADHYDRLGFELIAEIAGGERRYRLDVASFQSPPLPFRRRPTGAAMNRESTERREQ